MQFCPKCGAILFPDAKSPKILACNCGYKSKKSTTIKLKEKSEESSKIELVDKKIDTLPRTDKECPKCKHPKAFYYLVQTRSSDEAETQFFQCVKCSHKWRQYD
jgi:transcription factor S